MPMQDVKLPEIGEGVTEGEIVSWLVKVGDVVEVDQPVAEIMTDKATVEVPSPVAGTVKEIKLNEGDVVEVEGVLLTLDSSGAGSASESTEPPAAPAPSAGGTGGETVSVILPEIGEGVTEGELVGWLVNVGDVVEVDQPVAEVMTDKATVEVPTSYAGTVKELKLSEGDVVQVEGELLTLVTSGGVAAPAAKAEEPGAAHQAAAPVQSTQPLSNGSVHPPVAASHVLASPSTRRLARESGVDINVLKGSGPAGRVTREDVLHAGSGSVASASPTSAAPSFSAPALARGTGATEERVPLKGIRKKIAENMQMSKHIIPHFTLMDTADVDLLVQARTRLKPVAEARGGKITYMPFVIKALVATVKEFPEFNASIDDQAKEIVYRKNLNVGFAADTPNGLLVPVVKDADMKSLFQVGQEVVDLGTRARDGKLKVDEMKGATITITNIGAIGGNYATPIINHPEVAILGMYKIVDTAYPKADGSVGFKKQMNFTMTCDHRLIDGAVAARFLSAFIKRIEDPAALAMDMI
jgi:pyruvate dehydrogenase E2 component (dihydrolipoamide acetyltransferase)